MALPEENLPADLTDADATVLAWKQGRRVFGRYRMEELLGKGARGVVWRVKDEMLERQVALKFLPPVLAGSGEELAALKRETRRALELTHPNVVRIHDFLQGEGLAAISMEWVDGPTLATVRRKAEGGHLTCAEVASWLGGVGAALDHAHRVAGLVHRDLKPANVLLTAKGVAKVADFGISAPLTDSTLRVSARRYSSGTLLYMSPQQLNGEVPQVADDVYSLGAMLYELLTGKPPFYQGEVRAQIESVCPPSLAERRRELGVAGRDEIPESWERWVAACLQKDPAARPASAGELTSALVGSKESGMEGEMTQGNGATVPVSGGEAAVGFEEEGRAAVKRSRRGWGWGGVAAAGLLLLGGAYAYFQGKESAGAVQVLAEAEPAEVTLEPSGEDLPEGPPENSAEREAEQARVAAVQAEEARRQAEEEANRMRLLREEIASEVMERLRTEAEAARLAAVAVAAEEASQQVADQAVEEQAHPWNAVVDWVGVQGKPLWTMPAVIADPSTTLMHNRILSLRRSLFTSTITPIVSLPPGNDSIPSFIQENALQLSDNRRAQYLNQLSEAGNLARELASRWREDFAQRFRDGVLPAWPTGSSMTNDGFLDWVWGEQEDLLVRGVEYGIPAPILRGQGRQTLSFNPVSGVPNAVPVLDSSNSEPAPNSRVADSREMAGGRPVIENSLGMRFVWVPEASVYFSVWETRRSDYEAYRQSGRRALPASDEGLGDHYPATRVSWQDAMDFCVWLTEKERAEGNLSGGRYRLPTDQEWSLAAGMSLQDDPPGTRVVRRADQRFFPWPNGNRGDQGRLISSVWPMPRRISPPGNYGAALNLDRYELTAPVGSFAPNAAGLFDLGGNVWEWVVDEFGEGRPETIKVLRGGSYVNTHPEHLDLRFRGEAPWDERREVFGFRVVLIQPSAFMRVSR